MCPLVIGNKNGVIVLGSVMLGDNGVYNSGGEGVCRLRLRSLSMGD